jgi:multicomponent Na+:H+ antiporter subunit D
MERLVVGWIFLPFLIGFIAYLLPNIDRYLASIISIFSIIFGGIVLANRLDFILELIDRFSVTLKVDNLSGYFILTNGLVSLAVVLYCWTKEKTAYFYTQFIILHGSINSVFCCADLISLYVALEVIGIATALLISYPRDNRSIWIALRYLFISNTVMLFYLIGAILVFQNQNSFAFTALKGAPIAGITLILLGLLTKGGIFISGMWLPLTHAESDSPVSATLSGVVVKTGIFPIVRCAQIVDEIAPIVEIFSVASATIGVSLGMVSTDIKRVFAFSTISQLGYVLTGGEGAGLYALTHGLAKAGLFLSSGNLSSRQLKQINQVPLYLWFVLATCSFSIIGLPLLSGYAAKSFVLEQLPQWQNLWLSICSVGTTIVFAPVLFLSFSKDSEQKTPWGFRWGSFLLIGGLILANLFYLDAYKFSKIIFSLAKIFLGILIYSIVTNKLNFNYNSPLEKFENLVGIFTIVTIIIFGILNYELL